jgi:hypothetical protein
MLTETIFIIHIWGPHSWSYAVYTLYNWTIIDLGTTRRWVVKFTLLLQYPRGWSPQYPWYKRQGGALRKSGHYGIEKNLLLLLRIEPWSSSSVKPSHYTNWVTSGTKVWSINGIHYSLQNKKVLHFLFIMFDKYHFCFKNNLLCIILISVCSTNFHYLTYCLMK